MTLPQTALYDACVLYPAPLRDLLMHLATTGLVRARWSQAIHHEWVESLLKNRPDLSQERLHRTCEKMNEAILDSLVVDYETALADVANAALPDPNDLHVLAAAVFAKANVLVTYNLGDFPEDILRPLGIDALHPDDFVSNLLALEPDAVSSAFRTMRDSLMKPRKTVEQLLKSLAKLQLAKTVERLRAIDPAKL